MIPGVPPFAQATFDLERAFRRPTLADLAASLLSSITTPARPWFHLDLEPEGRLVPWDVRWELHP